MVQNIELLYEHVYKVYIDEKGPLKSWYFDTLDSTHWESLISKDILDQMLREPNSEFPPRPNPTFTSNQADTTQ